MNCSPLPRLLGEREDVHDGAKRRHTPEQIVRKLREAYRLLNEGEDVAAVCRWVKASPR